MSHLHTVIVPGVGGSDANHWQSWLQNHMNNTSRVEQQDWHRPVLNVWVDQFYQHIRELHRPVQVVAHSFGCLTVVAALNQYPMLKRWIHSILLVAPANPQRFGIEGFATETEHLTTLFAQFSLNVPALMIVSENDPWLSFQDAVQYAKLWNIPYFNQGPAGHINVASGYGKWPQVLHYLKAIEPCTQDQSLQFYHQHQHFHFAV